MEASTDTVRVPPSINNNVGNGDREDVSQTKQKELEVVCQSGDETGHQKDIRSEGSGEEVFGLQSSSKEVDVVRRGPEEHHGSTDIHPFSSSQIAEPYKAKQDDNYAALNIKKQASVEDEAGANNQIEKPAPSQREEPGAYNETTTPVNPTQQQQQCLRKIVEHGSPEWVTRFSVSKDSTHGLDYEASLATLIPQKERRRPSANISWIKQTNLDKDSQEASQTESPDNSQGQNQTLEQSGDDDDFEVTTFDPNISLSSSLDEIVGIRHSRTLEEMLV